MEQVLKLVLFVALCFISYLGLVLYGNIKATKEGKLLIEDQESIEPSGFLNKFLKRRSGLLSYDRLKAEMAKYGNPADLSPAGYIVTKIILTIFFAAVLREQGILGILIGGVAGFLTIDFLYYVTDKHNIPKIKTDLPDVVNAIVMQVESGSTLTTALAYAHLIPKTPRLRKSLSELSSSINTGGKSISEALGDFSKKFTGDTVASFVMMLEQSIRSGNLTDGLKKLARTYYSANKVIEDSKLESISKTENLIQFLLFIGIIGLVMYCMFYDMGTSFRFK